MIKNFAFALLLLSSCSYSYEVDENDNFNVLLIRTEFIKFEPTRPQDFPIIRESQREFDQLYQNVDTFLYRKDNECGPFDRFSNYIECNHNVFGKSFILSKHLNDMNIYQTEELYMYSDALNGEYFVKTKYVSDCVVVSRESDTCIRHAPVISRVTVTIYEDESRSKILYQKTYCIDFSKLDDGIPIEYDVVGIIKNDRGFFTKNIVHSDKVKFIDNRERCGD